MTELSDELLVAYVDGQLARDQSQAVERVLENDEIAAQRVEALRAAHTRLEAAFEAMLANELDSLTGLQRDAAAEPVAAKAPGVFSILRRRGAIAVIGGAMCLLMSGAVAGYALRATPEPTALIPPARVPIVTGPATSRDWQDDILIAHGLFNRDTFSVGLESQANIDLVRFHLGNLIGTEIQIPDLGPVGLTYKRAQVLNRESDAIAQLAYLPIKGDPVALYTRWDKGADKPNSTTVTGGVAAVEWRQENLTYLLAGRMSVPDIEKLADYVWQEIAGGKSLSSELGEPLSAAGARATAVDPAPADVSARPEPGTLPAEAVDETPAAGPAAE